MLCKKFVSEIRRAELGFTLVELAIALMIIGLLIGGILRGQELMENARITATIQQVKAYDGAAVTFRDVYGSVAGDIPNPGTRLKNCTGACATGGNGNSLVDDLAAANGGLVLSKTGSFSVGNTSENRNFWLHLANAGLISGIDAAGAAGAIAWGNQYPVTRVNGGIQVAFANVPPSPPQPALSGHFLIVKNNPANGVLNDGVGTSSMSALRAVQMDRKLDDGLPLTGDVIGIGTEDCEGTKKDNIYYTENSEMQDCNLIIRIGN